MANEPSTINTPDPESPSTNATSSTTVLPEASVTPSKRPRLDKDEEEGDAKEKRVDLVEEMLSLYFEKCSDDERRAFNRRVYEVERNKSIQTLIPSSLLLTRALVAFDFESTDLLPAGRILSMSFIKIHPRMLGSNSSSNHIEVFLTGNFRPNDGSVYVNPGQPSHPEALRVHRVKDSELTGFPPFSAYAHQLFAFLKGCDLLGHNIKVFDVPLLTKEFGLCGIDWTPGKTDDAKIVDTKEIHRQFGGAGNLATAYHQYTGEELVGAHNAEADTIGTIRLLCGMVQRSVKIRETVEHILRPTPAATAAPSNPVVATARPSQRARLLAATQSLPAPL